MLALVPMERALAVELADGKLSLNGFGKWAYGNVNNDNAYSFAAPGGTFGGGSFALALHAQLLDRGSVAAQGRINQVTSTTTLDWSFGEWRFSDALRLRIGVVPHAFGISGDVRDVGTLRAFYTLPASVYGSTGLTGEAVDGVDVGGALFDDRSWSLRYDAYFGSLAIPTTRLFEMLAAGLKPGGTIVLQMELTGYLAGGRLVASTPVEGLSLLLSFHSTVRNAETLVVGPSVHYATDSLDLRAEYFFEYEDSNSGPRSRVHVAYAEGSVFLTERVQAGVRAEIFNGQLLGYAGSRALLEHREIASTLNYWFAPGFVLKLSGHLIDGNRFAHPVAVDDAILAGTLARRTFAVIFGTQFSF